MQNNQTNPGKRYPWKHREGKNLGKFEGIKNRTVLYCWKVNNTGEHAIGKCKDPYYFVFDAAFREKHVEVRCDIDAIRDFVNDVHQYQENLRQGRMMAITSEILLSRMQRDQDQVNRYRICEDAFREITVDAWRDLESRPGKEDLSTMQETFDFVINQILSCNAMMDEMYGLDCRETLMEYFGELFELENKLYEGSAFVRVHSIDEAKKLWDEENMRYWPGTSLHFTHRPYLEGGVNPDCPWRLSAEEITDIFELEEIDMGNGEMIIEPFAVDRKKSRPIVVELTEEDMKLLVERLKSELSK